MSEPRTRRRFLADALFAGGALGAAALASRLLAPQPEPPVAPPVAQAQPTPVIERPRPHREPRTEGGARYCPPGQAPR